MSGPCPNHPDRVHGSSPPHEPMLLDTGAIFEPYNPPGCTVKVHKGDDPDAEAAYHDHVSAWQQTSVSGRVGVCKHCRALVFFDVGVLDARGCEPFAIKRSFE